jgi:RimJ/RimL family protein N-acetyltransferase
MMLQRSLQCGSKKLFIDGCGFMIKSFSLLVWAYKSSRRGAFKDLEAAEKRTLEAMEARQFKFIIESMEATANKCIGVMGLNSHGQLGYELDPPAWGRGYATEALNAYLPALFKNFPELEEVNAAAIENNMGSRRVLEKCGFVLDNQSAEDERRAVENDESDAILNESREEKLRDLRTVLEGIGLQQSVNAPPTAEKRRFVVYRYDRPRTDV